MHARHAVLRRSFRQSVATLSCRLDCSYNPLFTSSAQSFLLTHLPDTGTQLRVRGQQVAYKGGGEHMYH